jgi:hypothetical protein
VLVEAQEPAAAVMGRHEFQEWWRLWADIIPFFGAEQAIEQAAEQVIEQGAEHPDVRYDGKQPTPPNDATRDNPKQGA